MVAYLLRIAFWLTLVLGVLALVLTLSGLFSVLSYLVEQRGREIGVRMALGATRRSIGTLVLAQRLVPSASGCFSAAASRPRSAPCSWRRPRPNRIGRASLRSGRLHRKPALHRHGVRLCGADSRAARRAERSGRRAQARLIPVRTSRRGARPCMNAAAA